MYEPYYDKLKPYRGEKKIDVITLIHMHTYSVQTDKIILNTQKFLKTYLISALWVKIMNYQ